MFDCVITSKPGLEKNQKNMHELKPRLNIQCDQCEYKASKKELLTRHSKSEHLGIKYSCQDCEFYCNTNIVEPWLFGITI